MPYTRPYTGGFKDYPDTTTPINATALNTMDVGIKTANDQFQTVTTAQRTALSPTVGQAVWDSDLKQLMVYMNASGGNAWQPVGNRIVCASTTRPSTPFHGQVIYETDTKKEYTYNGSAWVQTNSTSTTSGVTGVSNLIVPPAVRCTRATDLSYTGGTNITWDGESYDTDAMHNVSSNTDRITISTPGIYIVVGTVYFTFTGTLTYTNLKVFLNGGNVCENDWFGSRTTDMDTQVTYVASLAANDYLQLNCGIGGATSPVIKTAVSSFTATWVGQTS